MMSGFTEGAAMTGENFYDPVALAGRFAQHGLNVTVQETATYFPFGYGEKEKSVA